MGAVPLRSLLLAPHPNEPETLPGYASPLDHVLTEKRTSMFELSYDPDRGLITLKSSGFYDVEAVQEQGRQIADMILRSKHQFGCARLLIVGQTLPVQASGVMAEAGTMIRDMPLMQGPGDRIALVFASSLAKLQAARLLDQQQTRFFDSAEEATDWLLADRPSSAAA